MKYKSFLYIILACLLWGASGIFVHYLAPHGITTIQMSFIRGFVSFIVIGVYIFFYDKKLFCFKKEDIPFFIGAGICIMLTGTFYFYSMQLTSISTSVVLMYISPVYVTAFSVFYLGEKFTPVKLFAVILVIIGGAFVSGVVGGFKYNLIGIIAGVLSGITYGAYSIVTKIEMKRKINPVTAIFYCYIVMAILAGIFANPIEVANIGIKSVNSLFLMLGLGIISSALPYFLYNLGISKLNAGTASSLAVIEPLAATLYSVLLFNEKISIYSICGFVCILVSVVMLGISEKTD